MTPEEKRARRNARQKERYATDPEFRAKVLAYGKAWRDSPRGKRMTYERGKRWAEQNREHLRRKRAEWYVTEMSKPENREASRRRAQLAKYRKYGLTEAEFVALRDSQGGVCRICGASGTNRRLDIDHDHATGAVRGLLCRPCNQGLGAFGDSPDRLRAAAEYLEANASKEEQAA